MFHLHAALDHGAYSCRQRHQFKSRAVLALLTRGVERSKVCLSPWPPVRGCTVADRRRVPGSIGSVREVKKGAVPRPGEAVISTSYRECLRQQCRGCERDDGIVAVADAGPQGGLRQTRRHTATTEHVCCQVCIPLPSRQQSDLSGGAMLCVVVSE